MPTTNKEKPDMSLAQSLGLLQRAQQSIPGGVNSHYRSKEKPHPLFFEKAHGSKLTDADGNTYVDFVFGRGPLVFGHSPAFLLETVSKKMHDGMLFGSQHELEVDLAEQIQGQVPCAEMVRFASTGTEAVHLALRLARGFTGRSLIVKFEGHYHGWSDSVMFTRTGGRSVASSEGIPSELADQIKVLPWNDYEAVRQLFGERGHHIAAVITEPVMCNCNCIAPRPQYLQLLRSLCTEHNALLIFDEVITGFRLDIGGAQKVFGVLPDIATFAKAMAGGFPISMVCGRKDVMQLIGVGRVMHAGTANANLMSVAAAKATIQRLSSTNTIKRLYHLGAELMTGLRELTRRYPSLGMVIQGPGPMFAVTFTKGVEITDYRSHSRHANIAQLDEFVAGMLKHGIRLQAGLWFMSEAHTSDDIKATLLAARDVLHSMASMDPNSSRL